jgi:hypothetical protein
MGAGGGLVGSEGGRRADAHNVFDDESASRAGSSVSSRRRLGLARGRVRLGTTMGGWWRAGAGIGAPFNFKKGMSRVF